MIGHHSLTSSIQAPTLGALLRKKSSSIKIRKVVDTKEHYLLRYYTCNPNVLLKIFTSNFF
jgi:hypothetical protein